MGKGNNKGAIASSRSSCISSAGWLHLHRSGVSNPVGTRQSALEGLWHRWRCSEGKGCDQRRGILFVLLNLFDTKGARGMVTSPARGSLLGTSGKRVIS